MIRRTDDSSEIVELVRAQITEAGLGRDSAAEEIGVSRGTLDAHLRGTRRPQARTLESYRDWLVAAGALRTKQGRLFRSGTRGSSRTPRVEAPRNVVDLFAGCGGLSLGFELRGGGAVFDTVLALDFEEPSVKVFNANREHPRLGAPPVARRVDLEEFLGETEVLAFYLDHFAEVRGDTDLRKHLDSLPEGGLTTFKARIGAIDAAFAARLSALRTSEAYEEAVGSVEPGTFAQTTVQAFHTRLFLPIQGRARVRHPLLWGDVDVKAALADRVGEDTVGLGAASEQSRRWTNEVQRLRRQQKAAEGRSQSKAGPKIASFLEALRTPIYRKIRAAWVEWSARRLSLRRHFFDPVEVAGALRAAYTAERQVEVVLGGPPCQGFSRVGRGKLRSLREQGTHAQVHEEAGDERNLLLYKYVLFVSALRPDVFLFENVSTFRSRIRTKRGEFDAVETLEEAFEEVSEGGLHYDIAIRDIQCAEHGVPQNRKRFFMAGVRWPKGRFLEGRAAARRCLDLRAEEPVPLAAALAGLPQPGVAKQRNGDLLAARVKVRAPKLPGHAGVQRYCRWIRRPIGSKSRGGSYQTDAHVAREVREDDSQWFARMGQGMRWLDYRCDKAPTLKLLRKSLDALTSILRESKAGAKLPAGVDEILSGLDAEEVRRLEELADGSLSIRLMLEAIASDHHLLRPVYLSKRMGTHGDWLRRLDARIPCRTIVSHMAKDTYQYVHPSEQRMLSVREAARIQTFPDSFSFGEVGIFHGFRMIGNAVPPLLSHRLAGNVEQVLVDVGNAWEPAAVRNKGAETALTAG